MKRLFALAVLLLFQNSNAGNQLLLAIDFSYNGQTLISKSQIGLALCYSCDDDLDCYSKDNPLFHKDKYFYFHSDLVCIGGTIIEEEGLKNMTVQLTINVRKNIAETWSQLTKSIVIYKAQDTSYSICEEEYTLNLRFYWAFLRCLPF